MKLGMNSVQNRSKNRPAKSGTHTHAHRQTDRIGPIRSSSGTMFWTAKTQIPLADGSETHPQNDLRFPVRIPFKEHLRLASVVALSSSGACGAIILCRHLGEEYTVLPFLIKNVTLAPAHLGKWAALVQQFRLVRFAVRRALIDLRNLGRRSQIISS